MIFFEENNITIFNDAKLTETKSSIKIDLSNVKNTDLKSISNREALFSQYINGIESYALFMISGVADEKLAFHSTSKAYLKEAQRAFVLLALANVDNEDVDNVKHLYFMWNEKQTAKKLKFKKDEISRELSECEERSIQSICT